MTGKYETLKTELIKRLSDSKERKLKQLLNHEDLGDRKPSQFPRHLQGLAGSNISKDLLITIWTSRLPQNIQTVIARQIVPTLELLADLADRVHEITPPSQQVASTSTVSAHASTLENLTSEIAELRRQMRRLTTPSYRHCVQSHVATPKDTHAASLIPNPTLATVNNLHTGEKHTEQLLMATDGCPNAHSRLFVTGCLTKMQLLVDTGSEFCAFPRSAVQQSRTNTTYQNRCIIDNTTTFSTSESKATSSSMISSVKILLDKLQIAKKLLVVTFSPRTEEGIRKETLWRLWDVKCTHHP
ncbi:hypothetical protein EVAR_44012_1 [Eumeta japonica]|uniref:Peptidase A2 domain-containing protein n=1 Tax=Eumeta variegata TaxID=151549 RepID=A0A4C1XCB8_EUMVA|nr:hypothetical protein EVAR_44012_1 [Eumeta japonica]